MNTIRLISILGIPLLQTFCIFLGMKFDHWYVVSAISAFIITDLLLAVYFVAGTKKIHIFAYSFLPLMGVLATFGLLFFIENERIQQIVIATHAFVQFLYFLNLYYALFRPERFQKRSLYHAMRVMMVALFFCMSATAYGFAYYLNTPFWITFPPFIILLVLTVCQILAFHEKSIKESRQFLVICACIAGELFFAISALPSSYYVSALLFTALALAGIQLAISSLLKERTHMETVRTMIVTAGVVLLIVITAPWR